MTTIAYKDGVIAYDSRVTQGQTITSDRSSKLYRRNGVNFFVSGLVGEQEELIKAYFAEDRTGFRIVDSHAIVDDNGKVFHFGNSRNDGYWKSPIDQYECFAIGSGSDHALTAMDLGCSAAEAVKMAAKRDAFTGGRIRKHVVKRSAES
ncbi:MAG: hypothetical protein ABW134_11695 [Candidatus Thiodiazotropha endolucinida]